MLRYNLDSGAVLLTKHDDAVILWRTTRWLFGCYEHREGYERDGQRLFIVATSSPLICPICHWRQNWSVP